MNQLMTSNQPLTMTSVEFLEKMINPARLEEGQGEVRYNDFFTKVKDELEPSHNELFVMESTGGRSRQVMNLDQDQMMLVGMRESKAVRKNVLSKIKQLTSNQPQIPTNFAEALQLAADQAKALELAAPKVAFVDNLVDRKSLMNATQVAQNYPCPEQYGNWHTVCGDLCSELGVIPRDMTINGHVTLWVQEGAKPHEHISHKVDE